MKLDPIGRMERPEELDLEDVIIPIIGYKSDHSEVTVEVHFRSVAPYGVAMAMLRAVDNDGNISTPATVDYLDGCVTDEGREAWESVLYPSSDVTFAPETVQTVYVILGEHYAQRPSKQRPGSRSGAPKTRRTTQGAASSRVSDSKP